MVAFASIIFRWRGAVLKHDLLYDDVVSRQVGEVSQGFRHTLAFLEAIERLQRTIVLADRGFCRDTPPALFVEKHKMLRATAPRSHDLPSQTRGRLHPPR